MTVRTLQPVGAVTEPPATPPSAPDTALAPTLEDTAAAPAGAKTPALDKAPDIAAAAATDIASASTSKRKRDEASTLLAEFEERGRKRSRLTANNLARHNRQMGDRSSSRQDDQTRSRSSRRSGLISTTDTGFPNKLRFNGIVPRPKEPPVPEDLDDVVARLGAARSSPSPSRSEFDKHNYYVDTAGDESVIVQQAWPHFPEPTPKPFTGGERIWKNFSNSSLATVSDGISPPKPDQAEYRITIDDRYPHAAMQQLDGLLLPTAALDVSIPHYVVEIKSKLLTVYNALHQAAYDGACIVQSDMHAYQNAAQPFPSGKVRALSVRYNGFDLKIDGHFSGGDAHALKYYMQELASFHPEQSYEQFKAARVGVRNAQNFGRERTEEILQLLIATAPVPVPASEANMPSPTTTLEESVGSSSASSAKRSMPPPPLASSPGGSGRAAEKGKGRASTTNASKRGRQM